MKNWTWFGVVFALTACGGVGFMVGRVNSCGGCGEGWLAFLRGDRPAPVASIAPQADEPPATSDEEVRARVLQLIDLKVLSEAPTIENPCRDDEFGVGPPQLMSGVIVPADVFEPSTTPIMPYADADETPVDPNGRFDLWMLLFQVPQYSKPNDMEEPAEMKRRRVMPPLRDPRQDEETRRHPEVDTLEFRPSDAKKGEVERFQQRPN